MVGEHPDDKKQDPVEKHEASAAKKPEMKPIPDTGWTGPVPSQKGGDYEQDFLNKPPYTWTSDKFMPKYAAYV